MRLLLIELFPTALRRNEKSMLFPFVKGLARACGAATRWLCFGGVLVPADEPYGGRKLRAELSAEDLATLARHLDELAPTHVVTSDLLGEGATALLEARRPRPDHLVLPTLSDLVFGVLPTTGMEQLHAVFASAPGSYVDLTRCGWLLEWLGVANAALARRHLVTCATPDYDAVMGNAAATASQCPITIVSGGICGSRYRVAKNRCFADVDLEGLQNHRGCSFCMSATMPPYTPAGIDHLALWERQLRRAAAVAPGGRNKGVYEFFDLRAFRQIDELARRIRRLRLPPSVFMFNPRIDEVLRGRERMERALPLLARAGHEVRFLSMGVENFAESENARFNKGISLPQVDEFLALAREWAAAWPGAFMPFKAGHSQIELGFIMFTPWTTLADVRFNLEQAAARGFSESGFWLYSTLLIQRMEPMYRLARQAGDVLCERYPDWGQVYGVYQNESTVGRLQPWRFRDPRVADYFALLVRVCAAARDGAGCAFFRDDPEFPLVERLYREAQRHARTTPLAVARSLLETVAVARAPAARTALLREVLERLAGAPLAVAEPGAGVRAAAPSAALGAVTTVVERLRRAGGAPVPDLEVRAVQEVGPPEDRRVRLSLSLAGEDFIVDLLDGAADGPCFLRSRHLRAVYHQSTPITFEHQREQLAGLLRAIDDGLDAVR